MVSISTEHLSITPGVCGGKACIAGHRIRVMDIVVWHDKWGRSPYEIVDDFPGLTLADVYAALAYYRDHRDEIESEFAASKMCDEQGRMQPSKLKDFLAEVRERLSAKEHLHG